MKRIGLIIVLALSAAVLISAQTADVGGETAQGYFRQEGIASWYGAEFEGRTTASGETFSAAQFTAAHPILPFGTMLKITNKHNNRVVLVRVNDRGPFVPSRIIDISQAAAQELDMVRTGTAPVIVESLQMVTLPIKTLLNPLPGQSTQPIQISQPARVVEQPGQPAPVQVVPPPDPQPPAQALQPSSPALFPQADLAARLPQSSEPGRMYQPGQSVRLDQPRQPVIEQLTEPLTALPGLPPETGGTVQVRSAPVEPFAAGRNAPAVSSAAVSGTAVQLKPAVPEGGTGKHYRIQVGAYKQPRNAVETFEKLKKAGLNPAYERFDDYYRVVVAGLRQEDLNMVAERLGQAGFREAILREEK
ncbi:MAG: septal ring lytic transglycosylase RlpA family protein [Treponema sp.]|jgi:rare lipoprotein A|nr:septal ring lytic transglycosylase RlpA family protein [Treponema sp.]